MDRRWTTLVVGTALMLSLVPLTAAQAEGPPVTVTFPSDCGTATLQECIDSVSSGSTVYVASGTVVSDSIEITKSLSLVGLSSPRPTIDFGVYAQTSGVGDQITVENFVMGGEMRARIFSGSASTIDVNKVKVSPSNNTAGISATVESSGAVLIRNSQVDGYSTQGGGIQAALSHPTGDAFVRIMGNRVTANGDANSGPGIDVYLGHTGSAQIDVMNNSVFDVAGCFCGGASGIHAWRNSSGVSDVNIVGNSISRSDLVGVYLNDTTDDAGSMAVDLFNNVVAKSAWEAVDVDGVNSQDLTVAAGYNTYWNNGEPNEWDGHSPGTGNLRLNPDFVDEPSGDLRLRQTSPLIDAGLSCSPGASPTRTPAAGTASPGQRSTSAPSNAPRTARTPLP